MSVLLQTDRRGDAPAPKAGKAPRRPMRPRLRRQLLGVLGLLVVLAIIATVILAYDQVFNPGVSATVLAPRAGLLMNKGSDVTLNGVTVGRVTSITPDGYDQARLGISLSPSQVGYIPANVRAEIQAPTVFGPKYLNLVPPAKPSAQRVHAGQVIEPAQVSTEIDTVFSSLVSVLNSVHPAKLSATLGAISTALNGQGNKLGDFIGQLNDYLHKLNPSLPTLGRDLSLAPPVASTYAAATPDLIKTLDNLRVTSGTLTSQQAQFDAFLIDLTGFSGNAQNFLADNGSSLSRTLATLLPTANLLSYYSPEISCLAASTQQLNKIAVSDNLILNAVISPATKPYSNPANLPVVGAASGPSCYGGPLTKASAAHWGRVDFNDGTSSFFSTNEALTPGSGVSLSQQLFGPAAPAASAAASSGSSGSSAKKGH
ncbi:MAG: MCE family protein [Nocardiopsaceae bacterium]|nr:MCE family protein [Nocardiopsaceae bacterium]